MTVSFIFKIVNVIERRHTAVVRKNTSITSGEVEFSCQCAAQKHDSPSLALVEVKPLLRLFISMVSVAKAM